MIAIVSPAKSLDFETTYSHITSTKPRLLKHTRKLVNILKKKKASEISQLMKISEKLANLNIERYQSFKETHTSEVSKPNILAFQGDVYKGIQADTFQLDDLNFAQKHLRVLSGLYGLLRPLDAIQPYRLEMGTRLNFDNFKTLYEYWDRTILDLLLADLKRQSDNIIVNLASNEYFKSIDKKDMPAKVIDIKFKDLNNGVYKVVSFYAKKARGLMARFMILNRINNPQKLKNFNLEGYYFDESTSSENKLTFKRDTIV